MYNGKKAAVTELTAFYGTSKKSAKTCVNGRDFYSLSYRYEGKISVESEGTQFFSSGESVTFIARGLPYQTEVLEDTRMAVVHFKLDHDIDFRNAACVEVQDTRIRFLFERLIRSFHVDTPVDFSCMSLFYELLARLEALFRGESDVAIPEKICAVREYMERSYQSPAVYVASLARRFGISTSYLRREFSRAYGLSPVAFLRAVRVGNAKNMLESGYLSIEEIAAQCGFSSTSYFIQVFHKLVGESPDRYRRRVHSSV